MSVASCLHEKQRILQVYRSHFTERDIRPVIRHGAALAGGDERV